MMAADPEMGRSRLGPARIAASTRPSTDMPAMRGSETAVPALLWRPAVPEHELRYVASTPGRGALAAAQASASSCYTRLANVEFTRLLLRAEELVSPALTAGDPGE